ncbi:MAG: G-D-S-L family lipolytic protein, partial [Moorea sp. SIO3I8]|nr:G-D-S-L family lipolytic protein [Moorena sp. SIO3I8]
MQTLAAPSFESFHQLQRTPLKFVVLGDSLIYGFGDPEGGGWVERLRRQWMLPDSPGHVLYNLGVRGDGVTQVHKRLE